MANILSMVAVIKDIKNRQRRRTQEARYDVTNVSRSNPDNSNSQGSMQKCILYAAKMFFPNKIGLANDFKYMDTTATTEAFTNIDQKRYDNVDGDGINTNSKENTLDNTLFKNTQLQNKGEGSPTNSCCETEEGESMCPICYNEYTANTCIFKCVLCRNQYCGECETAMTRCPFCRGDKDLCEVMRVK